ncbi:MAG TPA: glycosyltransferase family A protein, partial [Fimbriiglobus sp.]|nr:glycosyltransferase family A protein [Fimbriiglobus sp.]
MPRFSVVIPTRNRPNHFKACLETVAAQTFRDYEVIVQDNSDSPYSMSGDLETVRDDGSCSHCPTSRVFNRKVVAMAENWELAVARATGEYVLVVGDDDGLYPTCLEAADRLILANDLDALRWGQTTFFWPDHFDARRAGTLEVPRLRGYEGGGRQG